jgi:3'-5' exonuclease
MGKEHFTSVPNSSTYSKPKPTSLLVFDIETVPFKDEEYSTTQKDLIAKRLATVARRLVPPGYVGVVPKEMFDPLAEEGKIKGTDPYLSKVVCIGLYYPRTGQRLAFTNESEKVILESFWDQIKDFRGVYISFNGIRFDVPYIIKRSIHHGLKPTNLSFLQHLKYNAYPPHYDVMLQLCGRETPYSLKQCCDFFDIPSPKEGAVTASNVAEAYYSGRISEIAEYCLRDLESTYKLYDKVRLYTIGT